MLATRHTHYIITAVLQNRVRQPIDLGEKRASKMTTPAEQGIQAAKHEAQSANYNWLLESVARKIAECRERGIHSADLIAAAIGLELSNYGVIAGEFERIYSSFARTAQHEPHDGMCNLENPTCRAYIDDLASR